MPPEETVNFQSFLLAKIRERNISLKKLAEATGIAPAHLESLAHGRFESLPSAPYVHGYIGRLGKALDFDGEAWWEKIKKEGLAADPESADSPPRNRFARRSPAKFIWIGIAAALLLAYFAWELPIVFGKPSIAVTFPPQNPYATSSSAIVLQGTVRSANSISLNGDDVVIAPDGSWQKAVLLQNGLNSFTVTAKKLLGGETSITQQVLYQAIANPATSTSPTSTKRQ